MKDLNFFSIYSDKNSAGYKRNRMIKIGIIILAGIALIYAGLTTWMIAVEAKTQNINEYLNSPAVQKSIAEYNLERDKLTAIEEYNNAATGLIDRVGKINNVSTEIMAIISKAIPVSAKFENIDYNEGKFTFDVTLPSTQVAAQTVVRLEETELFDYVELSKITKGNESAGYNCNISAKLKVGDE